MFLQILLLAVVAALVAASAQLINKPICESSCGNVTISFPFGSGEECCYNPDFLVTCDRSSGEEVPFFGQRTSDIVISHMSPSKSEVEIMMFVGRDCYNSSGPIRRTKPFLRTDDLRISAKNKFVAIGCDTSAHFRGRRGNDDSNDELDGTGCISRCGRNSLLSNGSCSGVGCCEVAVPEGLRSFNMTLRSFNNHTDITDFNPCSYAFFVEQGKFNFSTTNLVDFQTVNKMPMLLDWAIGNQTCDIAKETDEFLCKGNSKCDQDYAGPGYRCSCVEGYEGNPYIENDCKNINECEQGIHDCEHKCDDTPGNYTCTCRDGYSGDGRKNGTGCSADESTIIKIALGVSTSVVFLFICVTWLYLVVKKRKLMMLREKYFKQNGGTMLQQRISKDGSFNDQAKVFSMEELKRATNNYDERKIIGKGGYGTVYKGVLSDNRIVAIKKSKLADQTQSQIEQFINEVVILSQINHRNVVKLIGCCLETEIPLLVYEFIPNGTLSDHIHNKGNLSALTWDIRLRIATETAEALSYLHSAASVPIIHRDVKPMNILLDDNYVAKVADFGASKLIPIDQIELATLVQGTLGYLDPEYLQTSQLTDKSDVYSFGVVLVELITGRKALSFDRPEEEMNLAIHFLFSLKQGSLFQILDERLHLNEVPSEIYQVSGLAERCLCVKGDDRPTMKEVANELQGVLASVIQKHPWVVTDLNENEIEYSLEELNTDYECIHGGNVSNGSTINSMTKQTMLSIANGR